VDVSVKIGPEFEGPPARQMSRRPRSPTLRWPNRLRGLRQQRKKALTEKFSTQTGSITRDRTLERKSLQPNERIQLRMQLRRGRAWPISTIALGACTRTMHM